MSDILDPNLKVANQIKAVKKLVTHIQKQLALLTVKETDETKKQIIDMLWIKLYGLNTNAHNYQAVLYILNDIISTIHRAKLNITIPEQLIIDILESD